MLSHHHERSLDYIIILTSMFWDYNSMLFYLAYWIIWCMTNWKYKHHKVCLHHYIISAKDEGEGRSSMHWNWLHHSFDVCFVIVLTFFSFIFPRPLLDRGNLTPRIILTSADRRILHPRKFLLLQYLIQTAILINYRYAITLENTQLSLTIKI